MNLAVGKEIVVLEGSKIVFNRAGMEIQGIVLLVRENSVMVEIRAEDAKELHYENNLTIVRHGKYREITSKDVVA
ncbi:DUF2187 family protein [Niallia taxi]|nr:DUF2187 family protein [Niallia taxi]MDE5055372.1 DUF2187 family protein [Niallia taxi]